MKKLVFFSLLFFMHSLYAQDSKQLEVLAQQHLLRDSTIATGHIGIAILDASSQKIIYSHQSDRYFIPASTTKLFTMYAGMKMLGDSLTGIYYKVQKDTLFVLPTGDPTFMHEDFKNSRVHDFLNNSTNPIVFLDESRYPEPYGAGWSMDDMNESFMPQRSVFPVNGNLFSMEWIKNNPTDSFPYSLSMINSDLPDFSITKKIKPDADNYVRRIPGYNHFEISLNNKEKKVVFEVPFEVAGAATSIHILKNMLYHAPLIRKMEVTDNKNYLPVLSQPTDSVLKLMMHRSDNFYAEQLLLMAGNQILGHWSQSDAIDFLLEHDFKDLPQKPRWVDGSGLSRYNLFTPNDEVWVIQKLVDSFGISRVKKLLPTGGTGTMKKMFIEDSGYIFAKTGSMSNNYCLSGILYTNKGKMLYFSIMLNNYMGSSLNVKKALGKYLRDIRKKF